MNKIVNGKPVPMSQAEIDEFNSRPAPAYQRPQQAPPDALQDGIKALLDDMVADGILPAAKATSIITRFRARKG